LSFVTIADPKKSDNFVWGERMNFITLSSFLGCTNIAPGETKRTCRQVGAHRKERMKNAGEFIRCEYSLCYNRLKQRKRRGL